MTDRAQMEAVVEAILFVSNDPVSRSKLLEVFDEKERPAASEALDAVLARYGEDQARGILIDEVAGGLRLVSRPDLHGYLRRFFEVTGSNKLSMPALESLAIIAYRQPVTAPEIQELRGVNSSGVLKTLLERRMIRIAGRKEVVGKPFLYATTREFLQHFGLKSLKELPPLEQFEELFGGDVEAAPASVEPDPEEAIELEVAEMEEQEDAAMAQAEADSIEAERFSAEQAEQAAAPIAANSSVDAGEPEAAEGSQAVAEPEVVEEPEAVEEPEPEAAEEPEPEEEPGPEPEAAEEPEPEAAEESEPEVVEEPEPEAAEEPATVEAETPSEKPEAIEVTETIEAGR